MATPIPIPMAALILNNPYLMAWSDPIIHRGNQ
jgi:hypothetical protein